MAKATRAVIVTGAPASTSGEAVAYALLRAWFAVTILTHGIPKLFRLPHGDAADAYAQLAGLIDGRFGLPFAGVLAFLVALLETCGAVLLALGLAVRPIAGLFVVSLLVAAFGVHGQAWNWSSRGMEYPLMLAAVAAYMTLRGAEPIWSSLRSGRTTANG